MAHALASTAGRVLGRDRSRLGRAPLVRRVHVLLGAAFWATLLNGDGPTLRGLASAALLAGGWWVCLELCALDESRRTRSTAWTAVQIAGATLVYLACALALTTGVALPVARPRLVAGALELGALAFVWQAYVAPGLGLGRPLRCLLVGSPSAARLLLREPLAPGAHHFDVVGLVDDRPRGEARADGDRPGGDVPVLGTLDDLAEVLARGGYDDVVIGARTGRPAVFAHLLAASHLGFHVVELPEFFEQEFGRVPVDEITSVWFLHALNRSASGLDAIAKRALDVAVAAVLVVLTAPLVAAAALAVKLTSPGPVLYRQLRVGAHGRVFVVRKLRSMRQDAERDGAVWAAQDDPRTTPVGRYLRRYRVDELPQLWNVLRGDMTMVGPRPERPEFVKDLIEAVPFYEPRHLTKPGLTGWAQVSAGYAATLDDARLKLSYDLYYLKHRGLALDLAILLRTVGVVLRGTGAR